MINSMKQLGGRAVKKYFIFIGIFIILFFVVSLLLHWLYGFLLTSFYAPDMGDHGRRGGRGPMNAPMSGQRGFNQMVFNIPFWNGLINANLSFWVSNKWEK